MPLLIFMSKMLKIYFEYIFRTNESIRTQSRRGIKGTNATGALVKTPNFRAFFFPISTTNTV